jgi:hypothetical protein
MLIRAWLFLGLIVAILSRAGFFYVLTQAGWHSGDPTGAHTRSSRRAPAVTPAPAA